MARLFITPRELNYISDITKELIDTTSKEKEKQLLLERLDDLAVKIKLFESMNSHDLVRRIAMLNRTIKNSIAIIKIYYELQCI